MKNLSVLIGVLVSTSAFAKVGEPTSLKIIGADCVTKRPEIAGSGVVFNKDGKQYVLTSEHVAFSDNRICYEAVNSAVDSSYKMSLVASDWEKGLALFQMRQKVNSETTLDDFANAQQIQNAKIKGYPLTSYSEISAQGQISTINSNRTALADSAPNIEITGVPSEPGLSGGMLLNADDKIIGILSHQRIELSLGAASRVGTKDFNGMILATSAIPADRARRWTEETLTRKSDPAYIRQSAEKIKGRGFEMRENSDSSKPKLKLDTKSAAGGGDGVGIGGTPEAAGVTIEIIISNPAELAAKNPHLPETEWILQVSPSLLRDGSMTISSMVVFETTGTFTVSKIASMADFIRKIRSKRAFPILSEPLKRKIEVSVDNSMIDSLLEKCLSTAKLSQENSWIDLVEKLQALRTLKIQYPQLSIPSAYIDQIKKHAGWQIFSSEDFDNSVLAGRFLLQTQ